MKTKQRRTKKVEIKLGLHAFQYGILRLEVPADADDTEIMDAAESYQPEFDELETDHDEVLNREIHPLKQMVRVATRFVRGSDGKLELA